MTANHSQLMTFMLAGIGEMVAETAQTIFADLGYEDDFCIQDYSGSVAVFGGTNRLCFNPVKGFYPDTNYCTSEFMNAWEDSKYG